jgi:predicted N-formylglutamate amidohydrolase
MDELPPVTVARVSALSPFILACDHASRRVPRSLGSLGLSPAESMSHIAWDIGAFQVATLLSARLDATLVSQNYSRLVVDCNRPIAAPDSIAESSDGVRVGGNVNLDTARRAQRVNEVFVPYHSELARLLDQRRDGGRRSLLVAVHSFTPTFGGFARPWHIGLMYRHDVRLGKALLASLRNEPEICVGDNEPYAIDEGFDYTLPVHGEARGVAHVGIEIRQDLIADAEGQNTWAARLARLLPIAAADAMLAA